MVFIVVIEDEAIVAMGIEKIIEELHHEVVVLTTMREALEFIENVKKIPDLMCIDINLGSSNLNGIDIAKMCKDNFGCEIIFITAYSDNELVERCKVAEPAAYILKPFKSNQVSIMIELALNRKAKIKEQHKAIASRLEKQLKLLQLIAKEIANPLAPTISLLQDNHVVDVRSLGELIELTFRDISKSSNVKFFTEIPSSPLMARINVAHCEKVLTILVALLISKGPSYVKLILAGVDQTVVFNIISDASVSLTSTRDTLSSCGTWSESPLDNETTCFTSNFEIVSHTDEKETSFLVTCPT